MLLPCGFAAAESWTSTPTHHPDWKDRVWRGDLDEIRVLTLIAAQQIAGEIEPHRHQGTHRFQPAGHWSSLASRALSVRGVASQTMKNAATRSANPYEPSGYRRIQ
jgi:hypothetical protein